MFRIELSLSADARHLPYFDSCMLLSRFYGSQVLVEDRKPSKTGGIIMVQIPWPAFGPIQWPYAYSAVSEGVFAM